MNYVILKNPRNISNTTTIKKPDYWIVYNFEESPSTELLLNGVKITREAAENYEIRYYCKKDVERNSEFQASYGEAISVLVSFIIFSAAAFALGK